MRIQILILGFKGLMLIHFVTRLLLILGGERSVQPSMSSSLTTNTTKERINTATVQEEEVTEGLEVSQTSKVPQPPTSGILKADSDAKGTTHIPLPKMKSSTTYNAEDFAGGTLMSEIGPLTKSNMLTMTLLLTTTLSLNTDVMTPSGFTKVSEMTTATPTLISYPVFSSSKSKLHMSFSEDSKQATTPIVEILPLVSTSKPVVLSNKVYTPSSTLLSMTSTESSVTSHSVVTSSIEPLRPSTPVDNVDVVTGASMTSSSSIKDSPSTEVLKSMDKTMFSMSKQKSLFNSEGKMTSSHTLKVITSSQVAVETSLQEKDEWMTTKVPQTVMPPMMVTSSAAHEEMTSSQGLKDFTKVQLEERVATSRLKDIRSPTTTSPSFSSEINSVVTSLKVSKSPPLTMTMTNSLITDTLTSSQGVKTVVVERVLPQIGFATSHQLTTSMTSSQFEHKVTSSEVKQSSSQIEGVTSTKPTKIVTSSVFRKLMLDKYSTRQSNKKATSQPTKTSIAFSSFLTSSLHNIQAMTTSPPQTLTFAFWDKGIKTTSRHFLKSSSVDTDSPPMKHTTQHEDLKITLTFSSSQLADLTTSSRPDVTSSSHMKTTTTEKNLESSTTPSSTEIMASQSSSPVAMSTSSTNAAVDVKVESTTSAPETKHNVTHTTYPTDHTEPHENITHSPHDIHVTHHTMGTPNEPDVDAATGDEEQTGGGEIVSIIVVLGLLGGMIAFVIFMIIKDRARTG